MKECKKCGETKPPEDFYKEPRVKDGLTARCIACCKADANALFQANPEPYRKRAREAYDYAERRARMLLKEYGITPDDYLRMFAEQEGKCACCGTEISGHNMTDHLLVDHSHSTGKVRGLLCSRCNLVLGHVQDDPQVLVGMLAYLAIDECDAKINEAELEYV